MMKESFFRRCENSYQMFTEECKRVSEEFSDVKFCVLQCDPRFQNMKQLAEIIEDISEFYNENWLGNADYIHIPDTKTVWENYLKYPIIMAYRENDEEIDILGVSTIKYYQNTANTVNPYYPVPDKRYFEITGILAKYNSDIKNIGKHIYEVVLEALKKYRAILPEFDVIFVADCRNYMSINGASGGARYLRESIDPKIFGKIVGFYTLKNNDKLIEAPTFIAKFNFDDDYHQNREIAFEFYDSPNLFQDMLAIIEESLGNEGICIGVENYDGNDIVTYYELENQSINLDDISIIPNGTDLGNDRQPWPSRKRVKKYE